VTLFRFFFGGGRPGLFDGSKHFSDAEKAKAGNKTQKKRIFLAKIVNFALQEKKAELMYIARVFFLFNNNNSGAGNSG